MWAHKFIASLLLLTSSLVQGRFLSLDLGADQWVLGLCPKDRIYAVSYLATSPQLSYLHKKAKGVPTHRNRMENFLTGDIQTAIAYKPLSPFYQKLLKQKGIRLILLDTPQSLKELEAQITFLCQLFDAPEKGKKWIQKLRHIQQKHRPKTLLFTGYQLVPGQGTFFGDLLEKMGFPKAPHQGWAYLSSEKLLMYQPRHLFYTEHPPSTPFWKAIKEKMKCHPVHHSLILTPYPEAVLSLVHQIDKEAA